MSTLKLEAGKTYRLRNNTKVKLMGLSPDGKVWSGFHTEEVGVDDEWFADTWYPNGRFIEDKDSTRDIVAEWVDEPPPKEPEHPDFVVIKHFRDKSCALTHRTSDAHALAIQMWGESAKANPIYIRLPTLSNEVTRLETELKAIQLIVNTIRSIVEYERGL